MDGQHEHEGELSDTQLAEAAGGLNPGQSVGRVVTGPAGEEIFPDKHVTAGDVNRDGVPDIIA